jgi:hypothetical protein
MTIKALVTLTSEESKRLIAKAIAKIPVVQKARNRGIIGFTVCTSAGFAAEEIIGESLDLNKYCCGFVHANGMCFEHPDEKTRELVLVKGSQTWLDWPSENISQFLEQMGSEDVIIKSGNVLGTDGKAAALMASPDGGEFGKCLPYIYATGIELIVPMTLNKSLHVDIDVLASMAGVKRLNAKWTYGLTVGLMPLPGRVVTEIEAFKMLADVDAIPLSTGAFGSGEGVVSIFIHGDRSRVENAWELIRRIKGEPKLMHTYPECKNCDAPRLESGPQCHTRRYPSKK